MKTLSHMYTDDNPYASYQSPKQQLKAYKRISKKQIEEKFARQEQKETAVIAVLGTICTTLFTIALYGAYGIF